MELRDVKTELDAQKAIIVQLQQAVIHLANIGKQLSEINIELKLGGAKSR
jgi:hypothetical protein